MYNYQTQRPKLFTEDGQVKFLKIRDKAKELLRLAGAATMDHIIRGSLGDSWESLACVDRLVELGELVEIPQPNGCRGQDRVFVAPN